MPNPNNPNNSSNSTPSGANEQWDDLTNFTLEETTTDQPTTPEASDETSTERQKIANLGQLMQVIGDINEHPERYAPPEAIDDTMEAFVNAFVIIDSSEQPLDLGATFAQVANGYFDIQKDLLKQEKPQLSQKFGVKALIAQNWSERYAQPTPKTQANSETKNTAQTSESPASALDPNIIS